MAVAVFAQWMTNWLVTVGFPWQLERLGPATAYGVYLFFAIVSIVFVARRVRETRGRTLEQM
jgi:SP family sugar:H+ symporter-like MFS transporter